MLYRQTTAGEYRDWTYIGEFLRTGLRESWSEWSGNFGISEPLPPSSLPLTAQAAR
jgi:hypothetical protein